MVYSKKGFACLRLLFRFFELAGALIFQFLHCVGALERERMHQQQLTPVLVWCGLGRPVVRYAFSKAKQIRPVLGHVSQHFYCTDVASQQEIGMELFCAIFKHVVMHCKLTKWPADILDLVLILPCAIRRIQTRTGTDEIIGAEQVSKEIDDLVKEVQINPKVERMVESESEGAYNTVRMSDGTHQDFEYYCTAEDLALALIYVQSWPKGSLVQFVSSGLNSTAEVMQSQSKDLTSRVAELEELNKKLEDKVFRLTARVEQLEVCNQELRTGAHSYQHNVKSSDASVCNVEEAASDTNCSPALAENTEQPLWQQSFEPFAHYSHFIDQRLLQLERQLAEIETRNNAFDGPSWHTASSYYLELETRIVQLELIMMAATPRSNRSAWETASSSFSRVEGRMMRLEGQIRKRANLNGSSEVRAEEPRPDTCIHPRSNSVPLTWV